MSKGTFRPYLLYEMFTHEKAGFPQTNEESPPFFVYRIKSRFSVKEEIRTHLQLGRLSSDFYLLVRVARVELYKIQPIKADLQVGLQLVRNFYSARSCFTAEYCPLLRRQQPQPFHELPPAAWSEIRVRVRPSPQRFRGYCPVRSKCTRPAQPAESAPYK